MEMNSLLFQGGVSITVVIGLFTYINRQMDKKVNKDVCKILHKQLHDDVGEIKQDVKKLLTKNGLR